MVNNYKIKALLGICFLTLFVACNNSSSANQVDANKSEEKNTNMKKDKIILVHSAWLGAWQWQGVKKILIDSGYEVITPDLPGHGENKHSDSTIKMEDYVNSILKIIDAQEEPVVLLGHSFNGITVSRVAELRPKKVKKLIYLTAFLVPNGASFFKAVQGVKGSVAVDNFYLSDDQSFAFVKENKIHQAFAQDVKDEDFEKAKVFIVPEPAAPLGYELEVSETNFGSVPKYYIECTLDNAIPIDVQRAMYKNNVKQSFSIEAGHTPNFSQPEKLAEIINQITKL
jgi:pimeloyl-ACP methyl ester carboxylesterase